MDEFTTVTAAKLKERKAQQEAEASEKEEEEKVQEEVQELTFSRHNVHLVV